MCDILSLASSDSHPLLRNAAQASEPCFNASTSGRREQECQGLAGGIGAGTPFALSTGQALGAPVETRGPRVGSRKGTCLWAGAARTQPWWVLGQPER